jgi:protein-S-isoprenylcysteine O-methyltransferase Ste14
MSRTSLAVRVLGLAVFTFAMLWGILFGTAGTLEYWQAWVFLGILFVPMTLGGVYFLIFSPELLERRLRMREKESQQQLLIKLGSVAILLVYVLPGLDQRFGWSSVPTWLVVGGDVAVVVGYGFLLLVLRENPYAGRTIAVDTDQTVIKTGPYGVVRHPMYLGAALMYGATPLALGSYWALIPAAAMVAILVPRTLNEEDVLIRDLPGYEQYKSDVRWRLIPGIW